MESKFSFSSRTTTSIRVSIKVSVVFLSFRHYMARFLLVCNYLETGAVGSISSVSNGKTHLLELFMNRLHVSMISLNYFNYNKQISHPKQRSFHLSMKIDLLPALAALIRRYKVMKLFYIMEGDEAFERFQAMMVAQAEEKSYDVLDIQGRQVVDIHNPTHTKSLLQSVEIHDRGSKEERYIVLDLSNVQSYVKLLMQVREMIIFPSILFIRSYISRSVIMA